MDVKKEINLVIKKNKKFSKKYLTNIKKCDIIYVQSRQRVVSPYGTVVHQLKTKAIKPRTLIVKIRK